MDDICNQGKDDYSDIQELCMRRVSIIIEAQTNLIYALGALFTKTSYFCLNTTQYIHVVVYSECFIIDASVFWRVL